MDFHGLSSSCWCKIDFNASRQGAPAIDLINGSHPAAGITEESKWAPPGHCRLSRLGHGHKKKKHHGKKIVTKLECSSIASIAQVFQKLKLKKSRTSRKPMEISAECNIEFHETS